MYFIIVKEKLKYILMINIRVIEKNKVKYIFLFLYNIDNRRKNIG